LNKIKNYRRWDFLANKEEDCFTLNFAGIEYYKYAFASLRKQKLKAA